ncbi:uncharacterized protein NEMAJ01_0784 [Nematocida major]|uniref:uncharacterized protein n=1 Tax=Nematocida major TaxID=1912982 RepID=UPI0020078618|nr:uncharacterized protein NEMAJ01_0784 [Nematocida major]KAH9385888.1 hypothetical protein NEMAJ01_0784 [Nematocida major]
MSSVRVDPTQEAVPAMTAERRSENMRNILGESTHNFLWASEMGHQIDPVKEKVSAKKADNPILTTEYWKAVQHREASLMNFFITSPISTLCYLSIAGNPYYVRLALVMLYLNIWQFLLSLINTGYYYVFMYRVKKAFPEKKALGLSKAGTFLVQVLVILMFCVSICGISGLVGHGTYLMKEKHNMSIYEIFLGGKIASVPNSRISHVDALLCGILIVGSTVVLAYTESRYRFVSDEKEETLGQFKCIVVKILTVVGCAFVSTAGRALFGLFDGIGDFAELAVFSVLTPVIYGLFGVFIVFSQYGTLTPWKSGGSWGPGQSKVKAIAKGALFIISVFLGVGTSYFIVRRLL